MTGNCYYNNDILAISQKFKKRNISQLIPSIIGHSEIQRGTGASFEL